MTKKSWKDHFLQSGVPLEHSVKQKLQELQELDLKLRKFDLTEKQLHELVAGNCAYDLREYQYDRIDENGNITTFSVDITTQKSYKNIDLYLLIECKYRFPTVKWVFCPEEYVFDKKWEHINTSEDWFITEVDHFCKEHRINREFLEDNFYSNYQHCYKGVEILPDNFNPKGIKQAFHQLSYAVPNKISDILERELDSSSFFCKNDKISIILPIIVTTADLWCINPGVSMTDLYESNNIEEISSPKDILIVHSLPDNQLKKYTNQLLLKIFNNETIQIYNEKTVYPGEDYLEYIEMRGLSDPGIFLIIKYDNFKEEMQKILKFFGSEEILEKREP